MKGKGSLNKIYTCLGASNHTSEEREVHDYYATHPIASELLLQLEPQLNNVWEIMCGEGHIAKAFYREGKLRAVSDLIDRGYYPEAINTKYGLDFLKFNKIWKGDIVTNPAYSIAQETVEHAMELLTDGHYLAMFLKVTFLEGKARKEMFKKYPPVRIWVSSNRIPCAKNGEFTITKINKKGETVKEKVSSAVAYAWFIWQKGYQGDTIVKWFN